jgi:hypothetical protein
MKSIKPPKQCPRSFQSKAVGMVNSFGWGKLWKLSRGRKRLIGVQYQRVRLWADYDKAAIKGRVTLVCQ